MTRCMVEQLAKRNENDYDLMSGKSCLFCLRWLLPWSDSAPLLAACLSVLIVPVNYFFFHSLLPSFFLLSIILPLRGLYINGNRHRCR